MHASAQISGRGPAGGQLDLTVVLTPARSLPAGEPVRLVFPHWYYAAGGPRPPADVHGTGHGRWHLDQALHRDVEAGQAITLVFAGVSAPSVAGPLRPQVLLRGRVIPTGGEARIQAGSPARLVAVAPSFAAPGESITLRLRVEDAQGNALGPTRPRELPAKAGMHRAEVEQDGLRATSNWTLVDAEPPTLLWADLHGHSALSDGRGTPEAWFADARDVGLLDVAALSDHDWQLEPAEFQRAIEAANAADEPGRFVAIPAFEINRWGHEVAWFFSPDRLAAPRPRRGARTILEETDLGLRAAAPPPLLKRYGEGSLLATHTSLFPSMGTRFPVDDPPAGYRLVEVYSAHGSSECAGCPRTPAPPQSSNEEPPGSLWDALDHHAPLALMAAGDSHDGRPGHTGWGPHPGGLTGIFVDEHSRAGVERALRSGRVFGTTGHRTVLQVERGLRVRIVGDTAGAVLELVADRRVVQSIPEPPAGTWIQLNEVDAGWRYVRLRLPGDHAAWGAEPF